MSNLTYFPIEITASYISESASCPTYKKGHHSTEWAEEEIKAIRLILQKLTALRIVNSNDAEDVVQDTLLTMILKRPQTSLKKGALIWGMGILRNKVGNYYRRNQRCQALEMAEYSTQQQCQNDAIASSPEGDMIHAELNKIVNCTLDQLPDPQRQVMEMLIAGLDPSEIVSRLSPERYQNVINRLHRGRKKLAQELAKYGYGPDIHSGMRKMKRCHHPKLSERSGSMIEE
jgi:RNA polymerase sigma factor (sigma-70 family)